MPAAGLRGGGVIFQPRAHRGHLHQSEVKAIVVCLPHVPLFRNSLFIMSATKSGSKSIYRFFLYNRKRLSKPKQASGIYIKYNKNFYHRPPVEPFVGSAVR